jgi:branched-chain amino acid transport system permease protein
MRIPRLALGGLLGAVLLILPLFIGDDYVVRLLVLAEINILAVLGLHLIAGVTGQLSIGHAAFFGIGAYAGSLTLVNTGSPYWVGILVAAVSALLLGLLVGWPLLRLRGDYFAIATVSFGQIVFLILLNWVSLTGGPLGLGGIPFPTFGPLEIRSNIDFYYLVLALDALAALAVSRIVSSRIGRALIAIRDDEPAAESMGIHAMYLKLVVFGLGALLAGLSGLMFASFASFISPVSFGYVASIGFLLMIIVGGMGSMLGAVVGAVVLTVLPETLRGLEAWRLPIYGAALVLLMIVRPEGLFGKAIVVRKTLRLPRRLTTGGNLFRRVEKAEAPK